MKGGSQATRIARIARIERIAREDKMKDGRSPAGDAILIWSCNDTAASHFDSDLGRVGIGAMRWKSSFKLGPYQQKAKGM